jgi:hypothetical protein
MHSPAERRTRDHSCSSANAKTNVPTHHSGDLEAAQKRKPSSVPAASSARRWAVRAIALTRITQAPVPPRNEHLEVVTAASGKVPSRERIPVCARASCRCWFRARGAALVLTDVEALAIAGVLPAGSRPASRPEASIVVSVPSSCVDPVHVLTVIAACIWDNGTRAAEASLRAPGANALTASGSVPPVLISNSSRSPAASVSRRSPASETR